jgi:pimeloyl-ACP methyl ester carboxylesterase
MRGKPTLWLAGGLVLCFAGAVAMRGSIETILVFPGSATQGRAAVAPGGDHELIPLKTPDGTRIVAEFGGALTRGGKPADDPSGAPTVIFFYGNGACAAYMAEEFWRLRQMGANVIMPDYPGYGMSGGRPSEAGFYAAADATYDYIVQRPGIDRDRVVAVGWSMGAAVAIDLALNRRIAALEAISAFTSVPAVAHAAVPWLPVRLILRSRFDNLAKIPAITCPIFIAHGTVDNIVPPPMAGQLAAAAKVSVRPYMVAGAGHNDIFDTGGDALWAAMRAGIFGAR